MDFLSAVGAVEATAQAALAAQLSSTTTVPSTSQTTPPPAAPSVAQSPGGTDDQAAFAAVAACEEGGADDPNYGYYGIKEWNGYDGYSSAGSAPMSVQQQWMLTYTGIPDESGGCHSY